MSQPHITNYRILYDKSPDTLENKVEDAIHHGWQPFGPLAVSTAADPVEVLATTFSQAVVKQSERYR